MMFLNLISWRRIFHHFLRFIFNPIATLNIHRFDSIIIKDTHIFSELSVETWFNEDGYLLWETRWFWWWCPSLMFEDEICWQFDNNDVDVVVVVLFDVELELLFWKVFWWLQLFCWWKLGFTLLMFSSDLTQFFYKMFIKRMQWFDFIIFFIFYW